MTETIIKEITNFILFQEYINLIFILTFIYFIYNIFLELIHKERQTFILNHIIIYIISLGILYYRFWNDGLKYMVIILNVYQGFIVLLILLILLKDKTIRKWLKLD